MFKLLLSSGTFCIFDNVHILEAAVSADSDNSNMVRPVTADRIVNALKSHDCIFAFFYRGCSDGFQVAELRRVQKDEAENPNTVFLDIERHHELKDNLPHIM